MSKTNGIHQKNSSGNATIWTQAMFTLTVWPADAIAQESHRLRVRNLVTMAVALGCTLALAGCSDERITVISDACSIDTPAKEAAIKAGEKLHIAGWAFDRATGTVPKELTVQVTSADHAIVRKLPGARGTRRDDVAKALGVPAATWSGFDVLAPTADLPPGRYQIHLLQTADHRLIACASMHFIELSR